MSDQDTFQNFLKQLGESISEDELKSLVSACQEVIPNEAREKIHKQKDLFDFLEKVGRLSKDNLIYLEHALEKICRPDLVTDVLDYKESVLGNSEEKGEISGPARKYKAMNKETGQVPDDIISGLTKIELAPPPSQTSRRKAKEP
ncbi:Astrocytic phosphoprotein PEA-15 [Holothuria leucospilota]|uniref:Astrocytic phosphoprotein PEA-15 n=1 Tax=Holothuria leucospilota TaxID=206669 RepID=A0A9Q1BZ80_HOLLE|nr:Astrocytic phosphoprotein PEA-15 [Holothuria leucospilota]